MLNFKIVMGHALSSVVRAGRCGSRDWRTHRPAFTTLCSACLLNIFNIFIFLTMKYTTPHSTHAYNDCTLNWQIYAWCSVTVRPWGWPIRAETSRCSNCKYSKFMCICLSFIHLYIKMHGDKHMKRVASSPRLPGRRLGSSATYPMGTGGFFRWCKATGPWSCRLYSVA